MDIEKCIGVLRKGLTVNEKDVKAICDAVIEIMVKEPQVLHLQQPVSVCGDIHGQFYDLMKLFKEGGDIPATKYLFLGDLVDRGCYSVETFLLLLALKVKYPDRIYLLRGNHETKELTMRYGFYKECMRKYGSANVWQHCTKTFDFLSISAVIGMQIFCVHGGLSPSISSLDQILDIDKQNGVSGCVSDLLWSDPGEENGWTASTRGLGYLFGPDVAAQFNYNNKLDFICRGHQLVMEGYTWNSNNTVLTVWSAPNYCYRCGNVAAIAEFNTDLKLHLKTFEAAPAAERGAPFRIPSVFLGDN